MAKQKVKRTTQNQATMGANDIASLVANARAGANKNLSVGPQLRTPANATQVKAIDASASDTKVNPGTSLWIYNNGALAWLAMGKAADGALTAPAGLTTAIPLKANDWTYLNMGENDQIRTSAATVGVYIVEDDTNLQVITEDQF